MAFFQLNNLLHGPTVQVLLDEKRDGCFSLICHDQPLYMLTYFSTTIREEFPANHPLLSSQWPTPWQPSHSGPVAVRVIGGSPDAFRDVIEWMAACCRQNNMIPLRSVISCPARYILAMDAIHRLGIDLLAQEIPQLLVKLEHELYEVDTVQQIFAAGNNLLAEVANAICHCVARYFFHGSLPEVENWMHLATMNLKFDDGVRAWLKPGALNEGPDAIGAWDLWASKSGLSYPARWHRPSGAGPSFERFQPPERPFGLPLPPSHGPVPPYFSETGSRPFPADPYRPDSFPQSRQHQRGPWKPEPPVAPPPPPPPKPDAYRRHPPDYGGPAGFSQDPIYTVRCNYCQQVHPDIPGERHRCTTGHAYTIASTPSPPPRERSYSHHRRASYVGERPRSPTPYPSQRERRHSPPGRDWDSSYEPPRPGEYLRERRQLGPDHFVHYFVDQYGRERVVTKGGDVSMEGRGW